MLFPSDDQHGSKLPGPGTANSLFRVRFSLLGVTVQSADTRPDLSGSLSEGLPEIVDPVLRSLDEMKCATSDAEPIDETQLLSTRR